MIEEPSTNQVESAAKVLCLLNEAETGEPGRNKTISQLVDYMKEKGKKDLIGEYYDMEMEEAELPDKKVTTEIHRQKNRYPNMLFHEHSRVVLSRDNNDDKSTKQQHNDYINANYVDGYMQKNAFISTQGQIKKSLCRRT